MTDSNDLLLSPHALKHRFAYMFPPDADLIFLRGWMPSLTQACIDIDALLETDTRGFHFTRIHEKFGTARVRYHLDGATPRAVVRMVSADVLATPVVITPGDRDGVAIAVGAVVLGFETASARLCLICGAPAATNTVDGWLMTLCAAHQPIGGVIDKAFQTLYFNARLNDPEHLDE